MKNSRRQDAATLYADLDGFTAYVTKNISSDSSAKHIVRTLHVLRSELDAVLHTDFAGRKVRFIGDCVHGLTVEGTAQTTDDKETISNLTLCAGGMRSSFNLALLKLKENGTDASGLGLQIGFEYGPMNVTRLGMKGELIRCSVSRGVLTAEREQGRCTGNETAIGARLLTQRPATQCELYSGTTRKRAGLDYDNVHGRAFLQERQRRQGCKGDGSGGLLKPATPAGSPFSFPNRPTGPSKPDGFA